jgi:hypothetical protein
MTYALKMEASYFPRMLMTLPKMHTLSACKNRSNINFLSMVNTYTFYLQEELDMIKISKDASKLPDWLLCTKTMIPDFVARDPKVSDKCRLESVIIICHSAFCSMRSQHMCHI